MQLAFQSSMHSVTSNLAELSAWRLHVCLSVSVCVCACVRYSVSVFCARRSLHLCVSLCLCILPKIYVSVCVAVSACPYFSVSHSVSMSVTLAICLHLVVSVSLYLSVDYCICLYTSICISICLLAQKYPIQTSMIQYDTYGMKCNTIQCSRPTTVAAKDAQHYFTSHGHTGGEAHSSQTTIAFLQ